MYPHSREYQGVFKKKKVENVITAEFTLPRVLQDADGAEGILLIPTELRHHQNPLPQNCNEVEALSSTTFDIRLDRGDSTWKFGIDYNWIWNLSENHNSIRGSVYFRSKSFGSWELFEHVKYFSVDLPEDLEDVEPRIFVSVFTSEMLESSLLAGRLEMTLKLEQFVTEEDDEQEAVLNKHRVKMNNLLLPTSPKSDLRIKVGDEEFFVHMRHLKAFSAVSEALSKYVDGTNWNWSDKVTPDSMQGLLRFIYYDEVDAINTPEVAFQLLQFSHLYQAEALSKICSLKLMSFTDEMFTFPDVFEMYLFVRISDEFKKLRTYLCGVLHRNASKYDTDELQTLARGYESGVGVVALVEILQYEEPIPPVRPEEAISVPAPPRAPADGRYAMQFF